MSWGYKIFILIFFLNTAVGLTFSQSDPFESEPPSIPQTTNNSLSPPPISTESSEEFLPESIPEDTSGEQEVIPPSSSDEANPFPEEQEAPPIPLELASDTEVNLPQTIAVGAQIIEIFPKDTTLLGEYIILEFTSDYQGLVRITGLGSAGTEKSFELSVTSGTRVVVTDAPEKITLPGITIITISSITLTDTGEPLQLFLGGGAEPADKVLYQTSSTEKALYFGGEIDTAWFRLFSYLDIPSVLWSSPSPGTGSVEPKPSPEPPISPGGCALVIEGIITTGSFSTAQISLSGSSICTATQLSRQVGDTSLFRTGCTQQFILSEGYTLISVATGGCTPVGVFLSAVSVACAAVEPGSPWWWSIEITEVHPGETEQFPEYLEILFHQSFSWVLQIEGLGQGAATKEISLQAFSGSYRIVTDLPAVFGAQSWVSWLPSISLTDAGEILTLRSQDGQLIDSVVYSWHDKTNSLVSSADFPSSTVTQGSGGVERLFMSSQKPTPGVERELIAHLLEPTTGATVPSCGIDLQHGDPLFASNKINLQAVFDGKALANTTSTYQCERLLSGSDLGYSTGCNPWFIAYPTPGIHPVTLRILQDGSPRCEVVRELNLPAKNSSTAARTSGSGSSYYEELYHKRKGRFEFLKQQVKALGYSVATSGDLSGSPEIDIFQSFPDGWYLGDTLRILGLIANPVGRDSEGETLRIENLTDDPIMTDDLLLDKGKSTKKLPSGIVLVPHQLTVLVGDLGLTNKPTCLSLRFRETEEVLSAFCYPQPQEGVLFTGWLVGIETQQDSQLLGSLTMELQDTQVCTLYEGQELLCKQLPFSITDAKEWKKGARKTTSLQKKVTNLQGKYDLRHGKYTDQSKKFRTKEAEYVTRARGLRHDIRRQNQQKGLYRALFYLLKNELIWDGQPVLWGQLSDLESFSRRLLAHEEEEVMHVGAVDLAPAAVQERYDFLQEGKLPLQEVTIEEVVQYLHTRSSTQLAFAQELVFDY